MIYCFSNITKRSCCSTNSTTSNTTIRL